MDSPSLHQLRLLVTVAERGSFTQAAEALHISQPAVSAQVRELERRYGQPLLERQARGVRLTEAGRLAVSYAERILGLTTELDRTLADLRGVQRGRLTLGASTTPGEYVLPALIGGFVQRYPGIEVALSIGNSQVIGAAVLAHRLDFGFVGIPLNDRHLIVTPFAEDEIVLFAAPAHTAAHSRPQPPPHPC